MGRASPPRREHGAEVRDHVRRMLEKLSAHIRAEPTRLLGNVERSQAKRNGKALAWGKGASHLRPAERKKEH